MLDGFRTNYPKASRNREFQDTSSVTELGKDRKLPSSPFQVGMALILSPVLAGNMAIEPETTFPSIPCTWVWSGMKWEPRGCEWK